MPSISESLGMLGFARWQAVVDFVGLVVAFYVLLRWSRAARALRITLAIVGLHALALAAYHWGLLITSWLLDGLAGLAVLLVLVVFQPELRRLFMDLDRVVRRFPHPWAVSPQHHAAIADACFTLAAARLGALLVIVRRDAIGELLEGGVGLGADISAPLLTAIFQKDSPLHDGAVIIEQERIARANVVLPLTQCRNVPREYGTRHRAAMGLAERCDALVIVVSEERGHVTVMDGPAMREVDPAGLQAALHTLASRAVERVAVRVRRALCRDLPLKSGALGLAGVLWGLSFLAAGTTIRTVTVPIEFRNVPRSLEVVEQSASSVEVQVRGRPVIVDAIDAGRLVAHFDLAALGPGWQTLPLTPGVLVLPPGVVVGRTSPASILVRLAPAERSRWP